MFDAFVGAGHVPMTFRSRSGRGGVTLMMAFLEQGTRDTFGAKKIVYKHLVDGMTAWTGGFTLEELKRDLPLIEGHGIAVPDREGMRVDVDSGHGFRWRVGLREFGRRGRWTVSTICTTRDEGDTRKMVYQMKQKSLGPIAARRQKPDGGSGQPDGAEYTKS